MKYTENVEKIEKILNRHPLRTGAIALFALSIFVANIFVTNSASTFIGRWVSSRLMPANIVQTVVDSPAVKKPAAKNQSVNIGENAENYSINATYPVFGIKELDNKTEEILKDEIKIFKQEVALTDKNEYLGGYSSVYADQDIISFKLELYSIIGQTAHGISKVIGINYDRKSSKFLTIDDVLILTEKSLEQISEDAKKQLDEKFLAIANTEGILPRTENFSTFLIKKNSVIFIFQEYQVAPRSSGIPEISIPRAK